MLAAIRGTTVRHAVDQMRGVPGRVEDQLGPLTPRKPPRATIGQGNVVIVMRVETPADAVCDIFRELHLKQTAGSGQLHGSEWRMAEDCSYPGARLRDDAPTE